MEAAVAYGGGGGGAGHDVESDEDVGEADEVGGTDGTDEDEDVESWEEVNEAGEDADEGSGEEADAAGEADTAGDGAEAATTTTTTTSAALAQRAPKRKYAYGYTVNAEGVKISKRTGKKMRGFAMVLPRAPNTRKVDAVTKKSSGARANNTTAFNARALILRRVNEAGREAWGSVDTARLLPYIERIIDAGICPCCGGTIAFGVKGSCKMSPSIDRTDAALPYDGGHPGTGIAQNVDIVCYDCNAIKNDATPPQRALIIAKLEVLLNERQLLTMAPMLVELPPAKKTPHNKAKCAECTSGKGFCAPCATHFDAADMAGLCCRPCAKKRWSQGHERKLAGTTTAKTAPHACTTACPPGMPFCTAPQHYAHVADASHMSTKGNSWCYQCNRTAAIMQKALVRARKRGTPYDTSPSFKTWFHATLSTTTTCHYCDGMLDANLGERGKMSATSISVDAIVPRLGYVRENIVICCHRCNARKNDATLEQLKTIQAYHVWRLANPLFHETTPFVRPTF